MDRIWSSVRILLTPSDAIEAAREERFAQQDSDLPNKIVFTFVDPGSVNLALEALRMAAKLDRYRETARMALEPWIKPSDARAVV